MAKKAAAQPKGAAPGGGQWWADAVEAPRSGLPDATKLGKRQRWYRIWVWTSVGLVPLALFAVLSSSSRSASPAAAPADAAQTSVSGSPGRSAAQIAVNAWLTSTPSPLPGGSVLFWNGARPVPAATPPVGSATGAVAPTPAANPPAIEVDSFVLTTGSGGQFTADVQVAVDPRGGSTVIAGPSLIPIAPVLSDNWAASAGTWQGLTSSTPGGVIIQSVTAWARAYTSGDSSQIRLNVGDPTGGHAYVPLAGVSAVTASVTAAAQPGPDPSRVIARVGLVISWAGQAVPPGGTSAASSRTPTATFDVLLDKANTASPVVVAWGGPGEGPRLVPYQNAVPDGPRSGSAATTGATPTR